MANILVDEEICKGCGLCVSACPKKIIVMDKATLNSKGYHPAVLFDQAACTGCAACAVICPDIAITVER